MKTHVQFIFSAILCLSVFSANAAESVDEPAVIEGDQYTQEMRTHLALERAKQQGEAELESAKQRIAAEKKAIRAQKTKRTRKEKIRRLKIRSKLDSGNNEESDVSMKQLEERYARLDQNSPEAQKLRTRIETFHDKKRNAKKAKKQVKKDKKKIDSQIEGEGE